MIKAVGFLLCTSLIFSVYGEEKSFETLLRPKVLLKGQNRESIIERMRYFNVPALSIAIVNEGKIALAKGFGHLTEDPKSPLVDSHTLFQAGSISKPIAAFGALILVQQGKISLDDDVNLYLKRWKIPENAFTKTEKVTLRRLLSHTAGTSVHGFPGYPQGTEMPTLVEILDGMKPKANNDPVRVIMKPGTEMKYSGGGTTIVQLLIEDITGQPFDKWMLNNVLVPLGMTESTFAQPLPPPYALLAASGYQKNKAVLGKWHQYPEMAAAGLWTTPRDLAHFITYIQAALKGEKTAPLGAELVKEMITRQKIGGKEIDAGLGPFLLYNGEDLIFTHKGQDEGFISSLIGFAYQGFGVVIMMNQDSAWPLMDEITNAIADVYHWPRFEAVEKEEIPIDPSKFTEFPGSYTNKEETVEITLTDGKLFIDFKNGVGPLQLHLSSPCLFFIQEEVMTIDFQTCAGKPEKLVVIDKEKIEKIYDRKE